MKQPEKLSVLEVLMSLPENEKDRFVDMLVKGELRLEKGSTKKGSEASSPKPQSNTDAKPVYDSEPDRPHREISMERWEELLENS
jgi:hypothetical protein